MKKNKNKYDFTAVATKSGVKCSDGRSFTKTTFAHMDGVQVPLLWQHLLDKPSNILGKALLEHDVKTGITLAHCTFNNSKEAQDAKIRLANGDIDTVSIRANQLEEVGSVVKHGMIKELSLVVAGANPEAKITQMYFEHSDEAMDEFIYCSGVEIEHSDDIEEESDDDLEHSDKTIAEIIQGMSEEEKDVMYALIGMASAGEDMSQSGLETDNTKKEGELSHMKKNIFDKEDDVKKQSKELTHETKMELFDKTMEDAKTIGFGKALLKHAFDYGISNIDILFPEARDVRTTPDIVGRDQNWVEPFLNRAHKSPFARFRSRYADLREDEARAKGYITANRKMEQVFAIAQRMTYPTTVYKKQKLDNDNIVDITDFDVVAFIKAEMRPMLREEIARAILVGDGRIISDPDKIKEENVRPIWTDDEFYSHKLKVDADLETLELIDAIFTARDQYKGTGAYPTLYTTKAFVTKCRIIRDSLGRNIYRNMADLEDALGVSSIVEVEVMEGLSRDDGTDDVNLIGIMVNMSDYTIGMDRGGQIGSHEFFDIDFNQHKFLLETRMSGGLTKWKSAVVIEQIATP